MITFKCKMCGGDLTFEPGASVAECPYCGTNQTLPKLDDDKRANLYDRANHFRRQNEFDKAMAIYEQVLAEDRTDAEAYWSLVLCRYGIEYVEDPTSHKRVPTVNRVQYASILADEDYKSALAHADAAQRHVYEAEANAIAEIQKGILDISRKEAPFDVFICYKETDANGRRTPDSVLANDMYHQLTKEGFKVFFSRITLEDKIGTAYEPYIFAALNSAKVMVVLGTKPDYFNAVWVKNEWSRYLALIRNGADKTLVPAYRDMDPYDLPDEFAHLQAQDMGKLGFMQDLIHGIKKILHKDEPQARAVSQKNDTSSTNIENLMKRAQLFMEDGDWENATEYLDKALDENAEYAPAYVGKVQTSLKLRKEEQLGDTLTEFEKRPDWQKAMRFASADQRKVYEGYVSRSKKRRDDHHKQATYNQAQKLLGSASTANDFDRARKLFESISGFDDADQKANQCREQAEAVRAKAYEEASRNLENAFTVQQCESAMQAFVNLGNYRDAAEMAKHCEEKRAEISARDEEIHRRAEAKAKAEAAKRRTRVIAMLAVIAIIAVGIAVFMTVIKPNSIYNSALRAMNEGRYDEASATFKELGDFRDASTQAQESQYQKGVAMLAAGQYSEAKNVFMTIATYRDSENKAKQAEADGLFENGNYKAAMTIYEGLDDAYRSHASEYEDMYVKASKLLSDKDYDGATEAFKAIGSYSDAATQALESQYQKGVALLAAGDYDGATEVFNAIGSYNDAAIQAQESQYQKGVTLLNAGKLDEAAAGFEALGDYKDAAIQAQESQYQKGMTAMNAGKYSEAATCFGVLGDYKDSATKTEECLTICRNEIAVYSTRLAAGSNYTVGLKSDGTVIAVGDSITGWRDTSDWSDIVAIAVGSFHTVGLKSDGTVVEADDTYSDQYKTGDWSDIVAIAAGDFYTVGLKSDGTVVAVGLNSSGQCDTGDWSDIVAIAAGGSHTVGLKSDGTVVTVGNNYSGQCDTDDWSNIVAIAAGYHHTVGLKSDGTVVAVGDSTSGRCDTDDWSDIVAIAAGDDLTVGLKSDGTVVASGFNRYGEGDTGAWTDIVAVAAGNSHTVGLKSDGTVVAVGNNDGQCDTGDWKLWD